MNSFNEKQLKEKINEALSSSHDKSVSSIDDEPATPPCETTDEENSLQDIIDQCRRVLSMKKAACEKSEAIEKQFVDLKQKLDSNSTYLQQMKKQMETLKFSHQKKAIDICQMEPGACLEKDFSYTSEEISQQMEDIRKRLSVLQTKTAGLTEEREDICGNHEEAFKKIMDNFEKIESGAYSYHVSDANNKE